MNIFKGYILSKNKKPIEDISEASSLKSIEQIRAYNPEEYMGVLSDDVVALEFSDFATFEKFTKVADVFSSVYGVLETSDVIYAFFKNFKKIKKNFKKKQLACGLFANISAGVSFGTVILRYAGCDYDFICNSEDFDEIPPAFLPLNYSAKNQKVIDLNQSSGNTREELSSLLPYLVKIMNKETAIKTVRAVNNYVASFPVSDETLSQILSDSAFDKIQSEMFFGNDGKFLFDVFSQYLVNSGSIIKIDGQLYVYKDGAYTNGTEWIERMMISNIPNLSNAKRKEVLSYVKLLIERESDTCRFNNLIAFKNGVYDIFTGKFLPHSKDYIITNIIDWDYDEKAYSGVVDSLLDKLSNGDKEIRSIIEEMVGYCFFRQNELGKAFVLIGPASNGKSTFQGLLQKLLGHKNISSIDLCKMNDRFMTAELYGKLANIGDDIKDEYIDDTSIFKTVVTGGRIVAEKKGQDPFEFEPFVKCIFSANNMPKMRDKTGAVMRRLVMIPFERKFSPTDEDFDPYIKYKLFNGYDGYSVENNMSYLINLGIAGLKRVLDNNGFTKSEKVEQKLKEYDTENNPIKIFLEDRGESFFEGKNSQDAYNEYRIFCNSNNLKLMSNIEFGKAIKQEFGLKTRCTRVNGEPVRIYIKE